MTAQDTVLDVEEPMQKQGDEEHSTYEKSVVRPNVSVRKSQTAAYITSVVAFPPTAVTAASTS